jgi:hypothetical protein
MRLRHRLRIPRLAWAAAGLAVFGLAAGAPEKPAVSDEEVVAWVAKQVEERQPSAEEKRFDEVGWAKDLRTALKLAMEHNRPVFLFTMDGRINTGRC